MRDDFSRGSNSSLYDGLIDNYVSGEGRKMAGSWKVFVCAAVLAGAGFGLASESAQGQLAFPDSTAQAAPNQIGRAHV